jgi:RNA polymerase sigma-70 factor (ECF subfamily)
MQEAVGLFDPVQAAEREELVRYCARFTGDAHAAEDLAQQTLLEAWRHERELRDPASRRAWLFRIARNTCVSWARGRRREASRLVSAGGADPNAPGPLERTADDFDIELELERRDLVELLDRALAMLPPEARAVLAHRYVEESPQAEMAARLGITEGAVEARLHRGKLALRRILSTELADEALAHGLISRADGGWEGTRIWCPACGRRRLEGWFRPAEGKLYMRCPGCSHSGAHLIHSKLGDGFRDVRGYKPAVSRVLGVIHDLFRVRGRDGTAPCPACGEWLPVRRGTPPWVPPRYADPESIYVRHAGCGGYDAETWYSLTLSLAEARRFWREHPRMRFLREREIEFAGSPAVVTGFESLDGAARLEVVSLRDTLEVVSIDGAAAGLPEDG